MKVRGARLFSWVLFLGLVRTFHGQSAPVPAAEFDSSNVWNARAYAIDGECPIATDNFYVVNAEDITNVTRNVSSLEECCELCANSVNCDGWEWCAGAVFTADCMAGSLQLAPHTCVLFTVHVDSANPPDEARLEYAGEDSGLVAGTVQVITPPEVTNYSSIVGFDFGGNYGFSCDVSLHDSVCMFQGNASLVSWACNDLPNCTAFVYYPNGVAGVQGPIGILKSIPLSQGFNESVLRLNPNSAVYYLPELWEGGSNSLGMPSPPLMPAPSPPPPAPPVDAASIRDHTLLITLTSTIGGFLVILVGALGFLFWRRRRRRRRGIKDEEQGKDVDSKDNNQLGVIVHSGNNNIAQHNGVSPRGQEEGAAASSGASSSGTIPASDHQDRSIGVVAAPVPQDLVPLAGSWDGIARGNDNAAPQSSSPVVVIGTGLAPRSAADILGSLEAPRKRQADGVQGAPMQQQHPMQYTPVSSRNLLAEMSQRQPVPAAMVDYSILLGSSTDEFEENDDYPAPLGWGDAPQPVVVDEQMSNEQQQQETDGGASQHMEVFEGQDAVLVEQASGPAATSMLHFGDDVGPPDLVSSNTSGSDVVVTVGRQQNQASMPILQQQQQGASVGGSDRVLLTPAPSSGESAHSMSATPEGGHALTPEDVTVCRRADGSFQQVGAGAFGTVFKGLFRGTLPVAIKVLHHGADDRRSREFVREISLLRTLRDPHIVRFLGACSSGSMAMLVTEFMDLGDLWKALPLRDDAGDRVFGWRRRGLSVALDVARGLEYLHRRKVVHLDLKSANILLSRTGTAKIADVGFSRVLQKSYLSVLSGLGTLAWSAPEVLAGRRCSEKADIYSFGVLLWEIVCGEGPVRGQMRAPCVPEECPPEVVLLMATCCAEDPARRPTAEQLAALLGAMQRAQSTQHQPLTAGS